MSRVLSSYGRRRQQFEHAVLRESSEWYAPRMLRREQNQRLYEGDLKPLLEKPDISQDLMQDIRDRLEHNGFVKILIVGDNNTGKSRLNELLSYYTAHCAKGREFNIEFPDEAPDRIKPFIGQPMRGLVLITSDTAETLATIKLHAHPGDCMSQDEDLALDGADSKLVLSRARSLFKAGRAFQVPYVVATPELHNNLVMFDWILHTWRINYKQRLTRCYVLSGRRHELMGWGTFKILPTGDNYRPWIRKKWATLSDLFDDQGSRAVVRTIRIDDAKRIATHVEDIVSQHKVGISSFSVFRAFARTTRIAGSSEEQNDLISMAYEFFKLKRDLSGVFGKSPAGEAKIVIVKDFLTVLKNFSRVILRPLVKDQIVVERWILRYFEGMTHKEIMHELGGNRPNTIGKSIRELDEKLTNTLKGGILEEAVCAYLNAHIRPEKVSPESPQPSSTDLFLRGALTPPGAQESCDVATGSGPDSIHAAVNCKLYFEHRPSWTLKCHPEHMLHRQEPPGKPYVLLMSLGPADKPPKGADGPHIYPVPQNGIVETGSVEEVEWKDWLEELRGIVKEVSQ